MRRAFWITCFTLVMIGLTSCKTKRFLTNPYEHPLAQLEYGEWVGQRDEADMKGLEKLKRERPSYLALEERKPQFDQFVADYNFADRRLSEKIQAEKEVSEKLFREKVLRYQRFNKTTEEEK